MFILLDLDGVLINTPPWKRPKILSDGFPEFDNTSVIRKRSIKIKFLILKINI